jgi:hypothetical protein
MLATLPGTARKPKAKPLRLLARAGSGGRASQPGSFELLLASVARRPSEESPGPQGEEAVGPGLHKATVGSLMQEANAGRGGGVPEAGWLAGAGRLQSKGPRRREASVAKALRCKPQPQRRIPGVAPQTRRPVHCRTCRKADRQQEHLVVFGVLRLMVILRNHQSAGWPRRTSPPPPCAWARGYFD